MKTTKYVNATQKNKKFAATKMRSAEPMLFNCILYLLPNSLVISVGVMHFVVVLNVSLSILLAIALPETF